VVMLVTLGSILMIKFHLYISKSNFYPYSNSKAFNLVRYDNFKWNSSMLCQGICGSHATFKFPSSTSHYASLHVAWTICLGVGYIFSSICSMS
jgi:hypothetical protein